MLLNIAQRLRSNPWNLKRIMPAQGSENAMCRKPLLSVAGAPKKKEKDHGGNRKRYLSSDHQQIFL